jgi:hypothetical protein
LRDRFVDVGGHWRKKQGANSTRHVSSDKFQVTGSREQVTSDREAWLQVE